MMQIDSSFTLPVLLSAAAHVSMGFTCCKTRTHQVHLMDDAGALPCHAMLAFFQHTKATINDMCSPHKRSMLLRKARSTDQ
jgi:hypothetical protein